MLSFLVTSVAILCVQVPAPGTSFQLSTSSLFEGSEGHVGFSHNRDQIGGFELVERDLENQNQNADNIKELNVHDALVVLEQISPNQMKKTEKALTNLIVYHFGDSLVSQLFYHIRYLVRNQFAVEESEQIMFPPSQAFKEEFTREALLADVENLSPQSLRNSKKELNNLKNMYSSTEMGLLLSNISDLLDMQPTLKRFSKLRKDVDKALGLDEPIISKLGLPVPTNEKPEVYFQLIDENNPQIKFFVKVEKVRREVTGTVLIKVGQDSSNNGSNGVTQTSSYTVYDNDRGLNELYSKFPISGLIQRD